MMRIFCFLLASLSSLGMLFTAVRFNRLYRTIDAEDRSRFTSHFAVIYGRIIPYVLIGCHIFIAAELILSEENLVFYLMVVVLFIATLFCSTLMQNLTVTVESISRKTEDLRLALSQIEDHNHMLQEEIDQRMHEIIWQDKLLRTVNNVATVLLSSNYDDFAARLWRCMGMLAKGLNVDRVYVWQNHTKDNIIYTTQIYEWSEGAEPQQGKDITVDIPLDEVSDWRNTLEQNQCINGPVKNLSQADQDQLSPQGILSVLVVPVILEDQFWGFIGFDDCHQERHFSKEEESILRSGALLITNAILSNDVTMDLVDAHKAALAGTRAKSTFLSNMSHEIRTPINAITGMSAIARSSSDIGHINECLDKIDAASRQLLGVINDVLDISQIESDRFSLHLEPFHMINCIHNIKSIVGTRASQKEQSLTLTIAPDVPEIVIGDEMRVSQILINILSNATKFTAEKGQLFFDVSLKGTTDTHHLVEFKIRDTGIGMTPEELARVFNKFEQADQGITRKYSGAGLGLVICKNLTEMMGGSIHAESTPGVGSTFHVLLPLEVGTLDAASDEDSLPGKKYDFSGRTALLVEDVEINQEIVLAIFESTGLAIDCASNGQIAVDMFKAHPEKYDIIFMDIEMPVMDGYTATRTIRELGLSQAKSVPIIAMTANAFAEDIQNCLAVGMNHHIAKPIDMNILFSSTAQYL